MLPIVDLHCDLLSYLSEDPQRTPHDLKSKTSYPQFHQGGVCFQTLALFCPTAKGSTESGLKQAHLFQKLLKDSSKYFTKAKPQHNEIQVVAAIENASIVAEEEEPLSTCFERFSLFEKALGKILYMSLTWNTENRFGGGNESDVGLKPDGEPLLKHLAKHHIAVDFSHTSDRLAEEILSYNDAHNLGLSFLASHSNFREVTSQKRNLPKWLAQEIIRRKGIIGLNLFGPFIGKTSKDLLSHVEYGLSLGGENALALGADFFMIEDFPSLKEKYADSTLFFPEYLDASSYPHVVHSLQTDLKLPAPLILKITSQNALRFLV